MVGRGVAVVSGVTFRRLPILDWRRRSDEALGTGLRICIHSLRGVFAFAFALQLRKKQLELVRLNAEHSTEYFHDATINPK